MKSTAVKHLHSAITSLFIILPIFILCCYLGTSFFQHPAADDYAGQYLVNQLGLKDALYFYHFLPNGNGRYSSVVIFLAVSSRNFFFENYFICSFLLFGITYLTLYSVTTRLVRSHSLNISRVRDIHLISMFLIITILSSAAESSTIFFWMAGGITYTIGLNLLLVQAFLLFQNCSRNYNTYAYKVITALLVIVLTGFNEICMYFSFLFLLGALAWKLRQGRRDLMHLAVLLSLQVIMIVVVFALPGTRYRSDGFTVKQGLGASLFSAFYQTIEILHQVFSNPVFLVALAAAIFFGAKSRREGPVIRIKSSDLALVFFAWIAAVYFFHFMIRYRAGWVLPLRAQNLFIALTIFLTLISAFLYSMFSNSRADAIITQGRNLAAAKMLMLVILVFNPFTMNIVQTYVSGPVYNTVFEGRIKKIREAVESGQTSVALSAYTHEADSTIKTMVSDRTARFIREKASLEPSLLYFYDSPFEKESAHAFAEYHGIDTIYTGGDTVVRWGLRNDKVLNKARRRQ